MVINEVNGSEDINSYENIIKRNNMAVAGAKRKPSSTELEQKYFSDLKREYTTLNIKSNSRNIHENDKVSITLSPELIRKAVKDPKVDKVIRKSLDDAAKYAKSFKANNVTRDGHKVKSVGFFIDRNTKISASLKLSEEITFKDSDEKKLVRQSLMVKFQAAEEKLDKETSLYYKYLSLLRNEKSASLDVTI